MKKKHGHSAHPGEHAHGKERREHMEHLKEHGRDGLKHLHEHMHEHRIEVVHDQHRESGHHHRGEG